MHNFVLCNKHVFLKAEKIFGSHEKATLWFKKPNPNLNGSTPLALLTTTFSTRMKKQAIRFANHWKH